MHNFPVYMIAEIHHFSFHPPVTGVHDELATILSSQRRGAAENGVGRGRKGGGRQNFLHSLVHLSMQSKQANKQEIGTLSALQLHHHRGNFFFIPISNQVDINGYPNPLGLARGGVEEAKEKERKARSILCSLLDNAQSIE